MTPGMPAVFGLVRPPEPTAMVRAVAESARAHLERKVIRGHAWVPPGFPGSSPRHEMLDAIDQDGPIFIISYDIHDGWRDTAANRVGGLGAPPRNHVPGSQYFVGDADGPHRIGRGAPTTSGSHGPLRSPQLTVGRAGT